MSCLSWLLKRYSRTLEGGGKPQRRREAEFVLWRRHIYIFSVVTTSQRAGSLQHFVDYVSECDLRDFFPVDMIASLEGGKRLFFIC